MGTFQTSNNLQISGPLELFKVIGEAIEIDYTKKNNVQINNILSLALKLVSTQLSICQSRFAQFCLALQTLLPYFSKATQLVSFQSFPFKRKKVDLWHTFQNGVSKFSQSESPLHSSEKPSRRDGFMESSFQLHPTNSWIYFLPGCYLWNQNQCDSRWTLPQLVPFPHQRWYPPGARKDNLSKRFPSPSPPPSPSSIFKFQCATKPCQLLNALWGIRSNLGPWKLSFWTLTIQKFLHYYPN